MPSQLLPHLPQPQHLVMACLAVRGNLMDILIKGLEFGSFVLHSCLLLRLLLREVPGEIRFDDFKDASDARA